MLMSGRPLVIGVIRRLVFCTALAGLILSGAMASALSLPNPFKKDSNPGLIGQIDNPYQTQQQNMMKKMLKKFRKQQMGYRSVGSFQFEQVPEAIDPF